MTMNYAEYLAEINALYEDYPANRAENLAANAQAVEACLGIAGEAGEVLDLLKKHWMYNKPLDSGKLLEELGDCLHYLMRLAHLYNFSLPTIMEYNAMKLRARFKDGYTHEAAISQGERT